LALKTAYRINGERFDVLENERVKAVKSGVYNFIFDKRTGLHMRWGRDADDDPEFGPVGPEILDLEISVNGCPNMCPWCYKGNTNEKPTNMTFETFKKIVDKMPPCLTQIAFGITGVQTNPDFIRMLKYCYETGIVPNFTLSGIDLTDEIAKEIVRYIGAVAVSAYSHMKDLCYDTIRKFLDLGVKQTNMHLLVSAENLSFVYEVLDDIKKDERLRGLNAVVLLGYKPKGPGKDDFHPAAYSDFEAIVRYALKNDIPIGFDSCSAPKFERYVRENITEPKRVAAMLSMSESCESSLFSSYINVKGEFWNCSFCEGEDWVEPVNVLEAEDFLRDVWYSPQVVAFRKKLLATTVDGTRSCPAFPEINHLSESVELVNDGTDVQKLPER